MRKELILINDCGTIGYSPGKNVTCRKRLLLQYIKNIALTGTDKTDYKHVYNKN